MPLQQAQYPIAPKGLATNFEESVLPPDYALGFKNRTINAAGGAEKRQGIIKYAPATPGAGSIASIHELVNSQTGAVTLYAADSGVVYRFDVATSAWIVGHDTGYRGNIISSVQMVDRLIFCDGTSRNFYTKDSTSFSELRAIIETGLMAASTSSTGFYDITVTANGFFDMGVAPGDIVYNSTRDLFGAVTGVSAANFFLQPTTVQATADTGTFNAGITHTAISGQVPGDRYQIIDTVELNIIPTANVSDDPDNIATAASGTTTTTIVVSAMSDWYAAGMRLYDFIVNTTRNGLGIVSNVSANNITLLYAISGQTAGDSLTFHKSAMPIASQMHVHYGRLYMVDSRDRHLIRISGPDDPTDITTSAGTIDAATFSFGSQQPTGDIVKTMTSFQRFLVMAGNRFTLLFEGTDPIDDDGKTTKDFSPIGLFPQGAKSDRGLASIGNDAVVISDDGVLSFALRGDSSSLGQLNLSEALKNTFRTIIASTPESDIQVFHYPRRSWICFKVGSEMYVYNYTPYFGSQLSGADQQSAFQPVASGSWSLFDGKFPRQKCFFVRQDGTLLCGGDGGLVYAFDQGVYSDEGEVYETEYKTGWLTIDEPRRSLNVKQGHYIQPTFTVGGNIIYSIRAEAPFHVESRDNITVSTANSVAGVIGTATVGTWVIGVGSNIFDRKFPLRWRGKEVRLTFTTQDALGPDVISHFTLHVTKHGVR